ncbi:MAG: 3-deoxy-D-manno-octulosonic acid transferase [Mariprofundaceae bacterium]
MQENRSTQAMRWRQHLGLDLPRADKHPIWLHACSVGEVASISPLVQALIKRRLPVHITVVTDTGLAHARRQFGDAVTVSYLPWDLPGLMRRLTARLSPRLLLIAETEFWPGLLNACRSASIPVMSINTRISDRSFPRYLASRWLWRRWLRDVRMCFVQSKLDGERMQAIGVDRQRIRVAGNLKFAVPAPEVDAAALRQRLDGSQNRPILLTASTHEGEEEILLAMLATLKRIRPDLLLVLVPRHPRRFDAVADMVVAHGFKLKRWSKPETTPADVVLIDAMGVLAGLYSVADLAFIGGSLSDIGGHNPLEAAVCGRGVITGPHIQNFRDIMQRMQQAGGAIVVENGNELESSLARLLKHPDEARALHAAAAMFMQQQSRVLPDLLAAIEPFCQEPAE